MKKITLILLINTICCNIGWANQITDSTNNFRIEIPDNWQRVNPPNSYIVLEAQNEQNQKTILIAALKIPANETVSSSRDMFEGVKNGMKNSQWQITNEHDVDINNLLFHSLIAHGTGTKSAVAFVSSAGEKMYSIQIYSNLTEASKDPEIQEIINSFRLNTETKANESLAYRVGYFFGHYMVITIFLIAIIITVSIVVMKIRRKKKS